MTPHVAFKHGQRGLKAGYLLTMGQLFPVFSKISGLLSLDKRALAFLLPFRYRIPSDTQEI